jgi:hypothetical protein
MRQKPTLARIISSVNVSRDGRAEDGLSTHRRIGTDTEEELFVIESALLVSESSDRLFIVICWIEDSATIGLEDNVEYSAEDFRGGVKTRSCRCIALDFQKPAGTSKLSCHLVFTSL